MFLNQCGKILGVIIRTNINNFRETKQGQNPLIQSNRFGTSFQTELGFSLILLTIMNIF